MSFRSDISLSADAEHEQTQCSRSANAQYVIKAKEFKPVPTSQCVTCHNQDALASKTDRLNFISKMKNPKTGEVKRAQGF